MKHTVLYISKKYLINITLMAHFYVMLCFTVITSFLLCIVSTTIKLFFYNLTVFFLSWIFMG